jgi:hypothetical protein
MGYALYRIRDMPCEKRMGFGPAGAEKFATRLKKQAGYRELWLSIAPEPCSSRRGRASRLCGLPDRNAADSCRLQACGLIVNNNELQWSKISRATTTVYADNHRK